MRCYIICGRVKHQFLTGFRQNLQCSLNQGENKGTGLEFTKKFAIASILKPRCDAPLTRSGGFRGRSASIGTRIFGDTTLVVQNRYRTSAHLWSAFQVPRKSTLSAALLMYPTPHQHGVANSTKNVFSSLDLLRCHTYSGNIYWSWYCTVKVSLYIGDGVLVRFSWQPIFNQSQYLIFDNVTYINVNHPGR